MDDKILKLKQDLENELGKIHNLVELDKVRVSYLGKKGSVTGPVSYTHLTLPTIA